MTLDDLSAKPGLLSGQRILITGGGTGLGRVMAEAFGLLGAEVVICGRRLAVLEQTAAELSAQHGVPVLPLACDLRDADAVEALVERIWRDAGPLTGLVNNAAGNFVSRTEDISVRGFDAIASTVFRGSFLVTLACGKRWLSEGRSAAILSIVTSWVWNGSAFTVPSAMSKAGIHAMTQSLAVEWGGRGIRLNAIAPGVFPTEGMSSRLNPTGKSFDLVGQNPMRRSGRMNELANLAVFLMAPGVEYLNGQTIAIDGGQYQASGGNFSTLTSWSDDDWTQARRGIEGANSAERLRRG